MESHEEGNPDVQEEGNPEDWVEAEVSEDEAHEIEEHFLHGGAGESIIIEEVNCTLISSSCVLDEGLEEEFAELLAAEKEEDEQLQGVGAVMLNVRWFC